MSLKQLDYDKANSPELNCNYFGIMDERSTADGTCLLVFVESAKLHMVRAEFNVAAIWLASHLIYHRSIRKILDRVADTEDGVSRPLPRR